MTTPFDADRLTELWKAGVVGKLQDVRLSMARYAKRRATKSAFSRGMDAGVSIRGCNPYKHPSAAPNFQRGDNSPFDAWEAGYHEGVRIRTILVDPSQVPDLTWREFKCLPDELKARANGGSPAVRRLAEG